MTADQRDSYARTSAIILMILYFLSALWPEKFWGIHSVMFLPSPWNLLFLLIPFGIVVFLAARPKRKWVNYRLNPTLRGVSPLLLGVLYGLIFLKFPMVSDYYGNARSFIPLLEETVLELPTDLFPKFLIPSGEPGSGREGVMLIYTYFSYVFSASYQTVFTWSGAICGGLFIGIWTQAVLKRISNTAWCVSLIICGATSPFLLVFMGHVETYAPLYLLVLCYGLAFSKYFQTKRLKWGILVVLLQILGIRFHMLMTLTLPALALLFCYTFWGENRWLSQLRKPSGIIKYLYLPICSVGAVVYFFVLQDFNDPRTLDHAKDIERLFLPLLSPSPPLDRYNLLSWNHIFDFLNNALNWSPCLIILLMMALLKKTGHRLSGKLDLLYLGFSTLLIITFLFMFNPLLSMPMDWDLFAFPAPMLFVVLLLLVQYRNYVNMDFSKLITIVGFAIMCLPTFLVHNLSRSLAERIETVGIHVYKTYYLHSSTYLLYSLLIHPLSLEEYRQKKRYFLDGLKHLAMPGNDKHYALLLTDSGITELKSQKDGSTARAFFEQALYFDPSVHQNLLLLGEVEMLAGNYSKALQYVQKVILLKSSNQQQALHLALRASLLLDERNLAEDYCNKLLVIAPSQPNLEFLLEELKKGLKPSSLIRHLQ